MNGLVIENPEKLSDTSFKITIAGKDYEYEASEEKDIDKVVEKLQTWIDRGPEAIGGLYDYIKRTFKLVGEYVEPITEEPDMEVDNSVKIPSDEVDIEEEISEENQLEISVDIDEDKVNVSMNDWTGTFKIEDDEDFLDTIHDSIKEEMSLKDRTELIVKLIKSLDAEDVTDFYNLINLVLNNEVDIIDSLDDIENEESSEKETNIEEPSEVTDVEEPIEDNDSEEIQEESEKLTEDELQNELPDEEPSEEVEDITIEELINNDSFIQDLITLDLSFFEITKDNDEEENLEDNVIYFIGGINTKGNKFSLSYSAEKPVELVDNFDDLKGLSCCLNNIEDLNTVVEYINKLLEISYNSKLKGVDDEG